MKFKITEQQINAAIQRDAHRCMIADALQAKLPDAKYIHVDIQTIAYTWHGMRYKFLTPPKAQAAIIDFDQGKKVEPFEINTKDAKKVVAGIYPGFNRKGKKRRAPQQAQKAQISQTS